MSRPSSATVFICSVFSAPSRQTLTLTSGFCTARSTSRKRFTTLPSMASTKSPGSSSVAAGRPAPHPIDAEHLPALRVVLLEALHPLVRQAQLTGARQGLHIELRFEGI